MQKNKVKHKQPQKSLPQKPSKGIFKMTTLKTFLVIIAVAVVFVIGAKLFNKDKQEISANVETTAVNANESQQKPKEQKKDLVETFTDASFHESIKSGVTLVDFWAIWCAPCRMQAPIIDDIAKEYEGKVNIGKLDTDKNPMTSKKYNIYSIPTLIVFKDGKEVERTMGLQRHEELRRLLNKHI